MCPLFLLLCYYGNMLYNRFFKLRRPCPFCFGKDHRFAQRKTAYLTYALAPYAKYHLLVIPKRHIISLCDLKPAEEKDIAALVKVGITILHKLKIKSVTVLARDGGLNKSVAHLHYHVIPNHRIGDLDNKGKPRRTLTEKEITAVQRKIHEA